jgi:hypothetical protein
MMTRRPWVIVGNPENRRVTLFQLALASRGCPPAKVLSYEGLLTGRETIASIPRGAIVRIESPGENFAVEKLLLAAGADDAEREGSPFASIERLRDLSEDRGLILYPRQWYLGFISSCTRWFEAAATSADCTITTNASNLKIVFDKRLCHAACTSSGLPTPAAVGNITCWDELAERMATTGIKRVFVKLANGSSASGVVALHLRGRMVEAITTVELDRAGGEPRLYNSLKLQRYTSIDDVRELINALTPHHVHAEEWLPKASVGRRVCDLRVLVVRGRPTQMVVRTSRSPLTNLHLGNKRGDLGMVLEKVSSAELESLHATCGRVAEMFPGSLHLGLDVLFTPGFRRHFLLEVNAFGDLLPGVIHDGKTTYQTEIDAIERGTA